MAILRIFGVQMQVSPRLADNLEKILDHIKHSAADFVLFPEMSLTGYHGEFGDGSVRNAWREIAATCRQHYVTALIGTGCRNDGAAHIQTRIYGDDGELLGTHEKLVPTASDRKFCKPGDELRVFTHKGLTFGNLIGNDLWVAPGFGPYPDPRLAYQLGQRGARAIFHSIHSGSNAAYLPYHESNLSLRAQESKVHIFTANAVDDNGPLNAHSGVVAPDGTWAVQCPRKGEQTYAFDFELDTE
jgi:predicted amidohydrolase